MFDLFTKTKERGPWFDGRARRILDRYADDAEKEVAEEADELVTRYMHASFRHPTGYYESQTRVRMRGSIHEVSDGGVVYGPWLEGTGSRNRTSRFKGYWMWRRASTVIERKAEGIAERLLKAKYLWRLR